MQSKRFGNRLANAHPWAKRLVWVLDDELCSATKRPEVTPIEFAYPLSIKPYLASSWLFESEHRLRGGRFTAP